jgi:hypothetical protein
MTVFWGISLLISLAMIATACKQNGGKVSLYWTIAFGVEIVLFIIALLTT